MSRFLLLALLVPLLLPGCANPLRAATPPQEVTLTLTERPASELVEQIARLCGSGMIAEPSAMPALSEKVSINLVSASWQQALKQIAQETKLDLRLDGDFLRVAEYRENPLDPRLTMRFYDVQALTIKATPRDPLPLDAPLEPQHAALYPTFEHSRRSEINEIIETIQKLVAPHTWEREGVAIEDYNGSMVITQTPEVHAEVVRLLIRLEKMAAKQVICRLYRLGSVPVGTGTILSAEQWADLSKNIPPPAAVFHARTTQRQRHFAGLQRLILSDVDQNQGLHAPDFKLLSTGLSLSVVPTATATDVQVETRLWATVAHALPTSVLRDADGTPLMDITTPVISSDHSDDVREIPHGGAAIYRFGKRTYALTAEVVKAPDSAR